MKTRQRKRWFAWGTLVMFVLAVSLGTAEARGGRGGGGGGASRGGGGSGGVSRGGSSSFGGGAASGGSFGGPSPSKGRGSSGESTHSRSGPASSGSFGGGGRKAGRDQRTGTIAQRVPRTGRRPKGGQVAIRRGQRGPSKHRGQGRAVASSRRKREGQRRSWRASQHKPAIGSQSSGSGASQQ